MPSTSALPRISPTRVFRRGHQLKVCGVATPPVETAFAPRAGSISGVAYMINFQATWDLTIEVKPNRSGDRYVTSAVSPHPGLSVSVDIDVMRPEPAAIFPLHNFRPQFELGRTRKDGGRSTRTPESQVAGVAHTSPFRIFRTTAVPAHIRKSITGGGN